jgi:hypothetical protein
MQTIIRRTVFVLLILTIATLAPRLGQAQTFTAEEVQKLKLLLQHVLVDDKDRNGLAGPHIIIEGANGHIQSGTGGTGDGGHPIGLGNLIIGYNEVVPGTNPDLLRTGSHNLVIGAQHTYTSHGGLVAGQQNTISGPYASVSGGRLSTAQGEGASVNGGYGNSAEVMFSTISGGAGNIATGPYASISGGTDNSVRGEGASISGGKYAEINELAPEGTWHGGGMWSNGQVTSLQVLEILGQ